MRVIVHQVRTAGRSKILRDLVQKERRNKVLRVIVHQVRTVGWPKTHRDLVQKERRNKVLRVIVHQVRTAGRCRSNQIIRFAHIQSHMPRNIRAVHAI